MIIEGLVKDGLKKGEMTYVLVALPGCRVAMFPMYSKEESYSFLEKKLKEEIVFTPLDTACKFMETIRISDIEVYSEIFHEYYMEQNRELFDNEGWGYLDTSPTMAEIMDEVAKSDRDTEDEYVLSDLIRQLRTYKTKKYLAEKRN